MIGINNKTGKHITGIEYLRQRITDVLTTPIGTRVMRRDYGSRLFDLIDAPITKMTVINYYAATAEALSKPINGIHDFKLTKVYVSRVSIGRLQIDIDGFYLPDMKKIKLEGIIID